MAGLDLRRCRSRRRPHHRVVKTGDVQAMVEILRAHDPQIKSGSLRRARSDFRPSLRRPPISLRSPKAGVPGYRSVRLNGVAAPLRTPKAIIDRLNARSTPRSGHRR